LLEETPHPKKIGYFGGGGKEKKPNPRNGPEVQPPCPELI